MDRKEGELAYRYQAMQITTSSIGTAVVVAARRSPVYRVPLSPCRVQQAKALLKCLKRAVLSPNLQKHDVRQQTRKQGGRSSGSLPFPLHLRTGGGQQLWAVGRQFEPWFPPLLGCGKSMLVVFS